MCAEQVSRSRKLNQRVLQVYYKVLFREVVPIATFPELKVLVRVKSLDEQVYCLSRGSKALLIMRTAKKQ